jgi:hypothetical protein
LVNHRTGIIIGCCAVGFTKAALKFGYYLVRYYDKKLLGGSVDFSILLFLSVVLTISCSADGGNEWHESRRQQTKMS